MADLTNAGGKNNAKAAEHGTTFQKLSGGPQRSINTTRGSSSTAVPSVNDDSTTVRDAAAGGESTNESQAQTATNQSSTERTPAINDVRTGDGKTAETTAAATTTQTTGATAAASTSNQTTQTPTVNVIEIADENTLIKLPGEKPKTVKAINFERSQGQKAARDLGSIDHERRRLDEQKRELERERQALEAERSKPVTAPAVTVVEDAPPPMPEGAIEGTPEWAAWQAQLTAYYTARQLAKVNEPIVKRIEREDQERADAQRRESEGKAILEQNQRIFADSLVHLPFEVEGLPEEVRRQIFEDIRQEGMRRLRDPFDLSDHATMTTMKLNPDALEAIIYRLYPEGSLPPGYSANADGSASFGAPTQQEPVERLLEQQNEPPVHKSQPPPMHRTTQGGGLRTTRNAATPTPQRSSFERMGLKWQ